MKLTAQTVSVDYAPQLARVLPIWMQGCDRILVVTAERDEATREICRQHGVETLLTDVFWENGASFNKGAAVAQGFDHLQPADWHLFFDADILPPADWFEQLKRHDPQPDCLYGACRFLENGSMIREREVAGCFHVAHTSCDPMQIRPIVPTYWSHAGNYDSEFQYRWPLEKRIKLPIRMTHLGEPFKNWFGVGTEMNVNQILADRRKMGGWNHERIANA